MAKPPKWKMEKLDRREAVALQDAQERIKAARQQVAIIVHGAARERKILVSGRNREALYKKIGDTYLQLDNGLKDWGKDLIQKGAIDWHDAAIRDIKGQTGIDPSNGVTRFSREYAEDVFKRVHPENGKNLASVLTEKMAANDIKSLRQAVTEVYREGALSGMSMADMAANIKDRWDSLAGNMSANRFVDASGRTWDDGRYLQMLVRTTTARVSRDSYFDTLTRNGDDLAVIQNVDGMACDICAAWDEIIISITGTSDKYPSYNQALDAGWGHPNCRCMAERVDETIDKAEIKKQSDVETPDFTRQKDETDAQYRNRMTERIAEYSKEFDISPIIATSQEKAVKSPIEKFVESIRPELIKLPFEKFIVLNPDGTKRFKIYTSGVAGGAIPKTWRGKLQGSSFIHNHPSGIRPENRGFSTSLSPQDVVTASSENMASIRAIGPKREYIMEPGINGWPERPKIVFEYNSADLHVRKQLSKRLNSGKIKNWQANQIHLHKVWKIVSKNLGMKYSLIRRK